MQVLLIALGAGVAFIVAYHTYGRWLGRRIFEITADRVCPSHRLRDGRDYVPTPRSVVFGHHFTSIAGTGPIVGPAIAVMWGWVPALLWVLLGSIFIGAVHDFGSLVVSLRNNGQSVGDIAGRVLNRRVRLLFLFVLFLALTIIIAIFGLVIAAVFKQYPAAITPCLIQIPLAIAIGLYLHRKGVGLLLPSIIALTLMYLSVVYGGVGVLGDVNQWLAARSMMWWVIVLLIYSYIASVLPVWVLLQPRDYINSLQLVTALGLVVLGLAVAGMIGVPAMVSATAGDAAAVGAPERVPVEIVAPAFDIDPAEAPLIFPFLFITIACGAISGFHCLVSSGTSSKQLTSERDARFVGFGSMLTEGFLATIVILACIAGLGVGVMKDGQLLTGEAAWAARYTSWTAANGLGAKVAAFVDGAANFLRAINLDQIGRAMGAAGSVSVALMGVLVASFAATTLDTATRLQRYVIQELAGTFVRGNPLAHQPPAEVERTRPLLPGQSVGLSLNPITWLAGKHGATLAAVTIAGLLAAAPVGGAGWSWANAGKGGLILWPLFGATNQLLGGLAFLVIAFYLRRRNKPLWFLLPPLAFMLVMPAWAMLWQLGVRAVGSETSWLAAQTPNWPLILIAIATLLLEAWMIVEAVRLWPKVKGIGGAEAEAVYTSNPDGDEGRPLADRETDAVVAS